MTMQRALFKDFSETQRQRHHEEVGQAMLTVTREYLEEMEQDSIFFRNNVPRSIPSLEPCEVQLDKRIGMGEFGVVLEVSSISLRLHHDDESTSAGASPVRKSLTLNHLPSNPCGSFIEQNNESNLAGSYSREHQRLRHILSQNFIHEMDINNNDAPFSSNSNNSRVKSKSLEKPRFAVKQIRKDLYPKKMIEAGKDLAREAKILARLDHPNIAGLRATIGNPGDFDFMLLLDRLGITLSEQVTEWHRQLSGGGGGLGFRWKNSQRVAVERNVLSERLAALYDMSRAMQYLHQKSIIFRDLKTENAARSHHGAFQLLDFGLAKEVKEKDRVRVAPTTNGLDEESPIVRSSDCAATYKLTGLTGTLRIMSPEVLECHPYGLSADVYSFGIVVWEVFRGDRNKLALVETIKGQRPPLPVEGMPDRIESVIKKCYADLAFRPTFAMLTQELEYQLLELHQEEWQAAFLAYQAPQVTVDSLDLMPSNLSPEIVAPLATL